MLGTGSFLFCGGFPKGLKLRLKRSVRWPITNGRGAVRSMSAWGFIRARRYFRGGTTWVWMCTVLRESAQQDTEARFSSLLQLMHSLGMRFPQTSPRKTLDATF